LPATAPSLTARPPFLCIICGVNGPFGSEEHVVPRALGNDLLVLARGWVCDGCNNAFSAFESRVLRRSVLGLERCRLGVSTKEGKPARSRLEGLSWFACKEGDGEGDGGCEGPGVIPLHDDTNDDIARLLLKMGVELASVLAVRSGRTRSLRRLGQARRHLVERGRGLAAWPYLAIRGAEVERHLSSVLLATPEEHAVARASGFDVFLHEVGGQLVFFFSYGHFRAGICLTSRDVGWRSALVAWGVAHAVCPRGSAEGGPAGSAAAPGEARSSVA
jgi:hypothetical protein